MNGSEYNLLVQRESVILEEEEEVMPHKPEQEILELIHNIFHTAMGRFCAFSP